MEGSFRYKTEGNKLSLHLNLNNPVESLLLMELTKNEKAYGRMLDGQSNIVSIEFVMPDYLAKMIEKS